MIWFASLSLYNHHYHHRHYNNTVLFFFLDGRGGRNVLYPWLDGQRAASSLGLSLAADAHRRQGRAQTRVAKAAVSRTESVAGSERVVPIDGVDGRLIGTSAWHWCRTGRVNRVRAAGESNSRVAHTVHHKLFGWPPFKAHEQHKRDTLQHHNIANTLLHTFKMIIIHWF